MLFYVVLALVIRETISQQPFEIEDIPIEQFEHAEAQNDEFDVELMPRPSRSLFLDLKPLNLEKVRNKREAEEPVVVTALPREEKDVVKALGEPLEVSEIDPEEAGIQGEKPETSEGSTTQATPSSPDPREDEEDMMINDFIRFRRASEQDGLNEEGQSKKNEKSSSLQDPEQKDSQPRETRGATKEQWAKLPYQVERSDELSYEDSLQSADTIRAPRVHFVTQNVGSDRKYDREPRSRSLNRDYGARAAPPLQPLPRTFPRDMSAEMDYYQPRYSRNYEPAPYRRPRYDPYYDPEPRTGRQFFPYDRPYDQPPERPRGNYNVPDKRQRRIIYYATLPEIPPRNPPAGDRYYGNRYYEPYPYRKRYEKEDPYAGKPRYEEHLVEKNQAFPVKVSTDLNVREVKKNPERRIYSDVERDRYNQAQNSRM